MISHRLHDLARTAPNKLAFCFKGRDQTTQSVTYAELDRDARHIAASILKNSVSDRPVYIAMRQSIGFVKVLYGCLYSGITLLPTYPIRNVHDIARLKSITKTVEPAFIIVDDVAPLEVLRQELSCKIITAQELMSHIYLDRPEELAECVVLQCSSGTTRSPKAIQVTKDALIAGLENIKVHFQANQDDVGCSWLPPYHDMGLIGGVLLPVYTGFTTYLMSPSGFMMNPLSWLECMSDIKATITVAPNVAYDLCTRRWRNQLPNLDLSSLRVMVNSAQMIQPRVITDFVRTFKPFGLNPAAMMNAYGLAEATLMVTCTLPGEAIVFSDFLRSSLHQGHAVPATESYDKVSMAKCGKAIHGMSIKIVDRNTGYEMPCGKIGEIWVSGNSITGGYFNNSEATNEIFNRKIVGDTQSYISTGDTGFISSDGSLYATGRIKDSIKSAQGLISAEEIEEIIESHDYQDPSYRCAALMITRHDSSEIVVLREVERTVDPVAHGNQMMYLLRKNYMIKINKIIYLRRGTIPTTTSGKVKRHAAIILYMHNLLDPLYVYDFDPSLDTISCEKH